jgi:hypothetical protein
MKIEGRDSYESFLSKHCFRGLHEVLLALKENVHSFRFAAAVFHVHWIDLTYWHPF